MKSSFSRLCIALIASVCLYSFALASEHMPSPDGPSLWEYMTKTKPYSQWESWPGYPGMYPGNSPHGAFLKLYANDVAIAALKARAPMPAGAIIVKENYGPDKKTLMAITPMYRIAGYNPEGGDWFWAKYDAQGKAEGAGKLPMCIECHSAHKDADWLFTEPYQP
jgi:hypothetical protein